MKRILFWGIAAVVGLSLISCENKENLNVEEVNEPDAQLFFASIEQPQDEAATKLFADSRLSIAWNAKDMISLFNRYSYNCPCYFMGEDGDYSGFFRLYQTSDFVVGNELDHIYAVYPYNKRTRISNDEVLTVYLPDNQQYAEHSFGPECNLMVSATDDEELSFKNACGYLSIKLYGEERGVRSITLWGNNGELISGKAQVTMPVGGVPEVEMLGSENAQTVQLSVPYFNSAPYVKLGATAEEYTEFWFVLPPVTFEQGFSIEVMGANGDSFVKETTNPVTIERSMITRMAPFSVEDFLGPIDYYTGPVTGESDWSLIGSLSQISDNLSWVSDWSAVQDGDIYVIANVRLAAADEFKIRKFQDWTVNRGGDFVELGKGFSCLQYGPNVIVGEDGIFDIYYNAALEQMAVCLPGEAPEWRVGEVGEAVDLGLSVKWASWNVGAYAPEEYGFYFAWGETGRSGMDDNSFEWSNYKWCNGTYTSLTKYNVDDSFGSVDNKTQLDLEDDVAFVKWGGNWRMPTDAEFTELRENCTWTWAAQSGVDGYMVTSNSNDNSIFLPAAGCIYLYGYSDKGVNGYYWSSTLNTETGSSGAMSIIFYNGFVSSFKGNRFCGFSVRPVIE